MEENKVEGVARYFPPRLSLREHFAGMAMQGLLTATDKEGVWTTDPHGAANYAVLCADALIKELNKQIQ